VRSVRRNAMHSDARLGKRGKCQSYPSPQSVPGCTVIACPSSASVLVVILLYSDPLLSRLCAHSGLVALRTVKASLNQPSVIFNCKLNLYRIVPIALVNLLSRAAIG